MHTYSPSTYLVSPLQETVFFATQNGGMLSYRNVVNPSTPIKFEQSTRTVMNTIIRIPLFLITTSILSNLIIFQEDYLAFYALYNYISL